MTFPGQFDKIVPSAPAPDFPPERGWIKSHRCCVTRKGKWKKRYETEESANLRKFLSDIENFYPRADLDTYRCPCCGYWHIGRLKSVNK